MRKNLLICMFSALLAGAVVTSCSNDDPEKVVCPIETTTFNDANGLALTYSGQPMLGKQVVFSRMEIYRPSLRIKLRTQNG